MSNIPAACETSNPQIKSSRAYTDTIILIWYQNGRYRDFIQTLSTEYGRRLQYRRLYKRRDDAPVPWVMKIQQPSVATLRALQGIQQKHLKLPPFVLHRVDIAIDFLYETPEEATETTSYLRQHIQQKYRHRSHRSNQVETTTYIKSDGRARRNICLYGDKLSKVTSTPCAHLELRFRRSASIKAAGLGLASLVEGVDPMLLLKRQCKLTSIDTNKLHRLVRAASMNTVRKHTGRYIVMDVQKQISKTLCRTLQVNENTALTWDTISNACSQELYDAVPYFRSCLIELPWEGFTTPPAWHVWDENAQHLADRPHTTTALRRSSMETNNFSLPPENPYNPTTTNKVVEIEMEIEMEKQQGAELTDTQTGICDYLPPYLRDSHIDVQNLYLSMMRHDAEAHRLQREIEWNRLDP